MPLDSGNHSDRLTGHALRNAHLLECALARAETAPPLARLVVHIRAKTLGMTRLEFCRQSGLRRGTLRDLELGIHTPTRRVLQQFVAFCQERQVSLDQLEELRRVYAGPSDTLQHLIGRLELRAGSPRELARRVGISPATLWEYRRGNFPMPLELLRKFCTAVGEDPGPAEALWHEAERQRFLQRGYPEALAEFWVLCGRMSYAERHLIKLGITTATLRRLRYLELPPWSKVAPAARHLCRSEAEFLKLKQLWNGPTNGKATPSCDGFGPRVQQLRKQQGMTRRQLADLFGIGGKKPARIIKYIEEDGFYSAQAHPAGLAALFCTTRAQQVQLLQSWQERRKQFQRRHRPETRVDLRLARELYGFEIKDMEPVLGYSRLEYQRIERGVTSLHTGGVARILEAIHRAGERRVEALLRKQATRNLQCGAWRNPPTMTALLSLLAKREGGLLPLTRYLKQAGLKRLWTGRLRAILRGKETPPWKVLEQIGKVCGVTDLSEAHRDWREGYRRSFQGKRLSPLGIELRLLIAEVAITLRAFSPRLGFNYSVLIRDLQRIDRDEPVKWFHVERILRAVGVHMEDERWREIRALWSTAKERRKRLRFPERRPTPWAGLG